MKPDKSHFPLMALDEAVAGGQIDKARTLLGELDPDERKILEIELGPQAVERLYRTATQKALRAKQGRVVVLHGIMGSTLDSVDATGDRDRIWLHYLRVALGRLADLELSVPGGPTPEVPTIKVGRLMERYYMPLIFVLDQDWHVKPFAFDRRVDIDESAANLAAEIDAWAGGEPVHLVAHSMGGLVCRRFIQKFPELWQSMDDPEGHHLGGRLVMLGTPNFGSFAVPLMLTGEDKVVRGLAKLDQKHNRRQLLGFTNTFAGGYQMMPSPRIDLGDDHSLLFEQDAWGEFPVYQNLLDRGRSFQEEMSEVITPERLLYVAGYDVETPSRIFKLGAGDFEYEETLEGDGRVPHRLGLLPGVRTFWVRESHGNLPKNARVMDAMNDLLRQGETQRLDPERISLRAMPAGIDRKRASEIGEFDAQTEALLEKAAAASQGRGPELTSREQALLEALILEDYFGTPIEGKKLAAEEIPGEVFQK